MKNHSNEDKHPIYSCSKSITSIIRGIYMNRIEKLKKGDLIGIFSPS